MVGHSFGQTENGYSGVNNKLLNLQQKSKRTQMKTRIIYVGTLRDLALIFEPDEEPESEEFFQSMLNNNNK